MNAAQGLCSMYLSSLVQCHHSLPLSSGCAATCEMADEVGVGRWTRACAPSFDVARALDPTSSLLTFTTFKLARLTLVASDRLLKHQNIKLTHKASTMSGAIKISELSRTPAPPHPVSSSRIAYSPSLFFSLSRLHPQLDPASQKFQGQ